MYVTHQISVLLAHCATLCPSCILLLLQNVSKVQVESKLILWKLFFSLQSFLHFDENHLTFRFFLVQFDWKKEESNLFVDVLRYCFDSLNNSEIRMKNPTVITIMQYSKIHSCVEYCLKIGHLYKSREVGMCAVLGPSAITSQKTSALQCVVV